jgi:NADPH:quinone reductase-like Zn-dependent oxidoreductase
MLRCLWTSKFTDKTASFAFARESLEELEALREMIEKGEVHSIVEEVLPMEQVADAHRRVEAETRLGAIVISLASR